MDCLRITFQAVTLTTLLRMWFIYGVLSLGSRLCLSSVLSGISHLWIKIRIEEEDLFSNSLETLWFRPLRYQQICLKFTRFIQEDVQVMIQITPIKSRQSVCSIKLLFYSIYIEISRLINILISIQACIELLKILVHGIVNIHIACCQSPALYPPTSFHTSANLYISSIKHKPPFKVSAEKWQEIHVDTWGGIIALPNAKTKGQEKKCASSLCFDFRR